MDGIWKSLWKSKVHERLKIFGWRILANALPTRELLGRRLGLTNTFCLVCGNESESSFHLFKECTRAREIAFICRWGGRNDQWQGSNMAELMDFCINPPSSIRNGE